MKVSRDISRANQGDLKSGLFWDGCIHIEPSMLLKLVRIITADEEQETQRVASGKHSLAVTLLCWLLKQREVFAVHF